VSISRWHTDKHTLTRGLSFEVSESLYTESSQYQSIEIVQTPDFGKVMLLDGVLMLTEADEFVYHEMLCHPPLFSHPHPRRVLIIGGGDCGTLARVLSHPEVEQAVQVEIDEMVTRVAKQHFPQLTKAIDDPRAELIFMDGIAYMREHQAEFDVILVDSTDPVGPAAGLFRKDFFADCHSALRDEGILCIQSESPYIPSLQTVIRSANQDLRELFNVVKPYLASIQTYQAGLWLFQMAYKDYPASFGYSPIRPLTMPCRYYNEGIHMACFVLPEFVKELLRG